MFMLNAIRIVSSSFLISSLVLLPSQIVVIWNPDNLSTLEGTSTVVNTTSSLVLVQFTRVFHVALVNCTVVEDDEDSGSDTLAWIKMPIKE